VRLCYWEKGSADGGDFGVRVKANTQSDYLLTELRRFANRPALREVRERLSHRQPVRTKVQPADAVREDRERL
jgi:hypothetical protein